MAELAPRVLAWNRVAANRRNTRRLLALLGALLVPVLSGLTVWAYPWFEVPAVLIFGAGLEESSISPARWLQFFLIGLSAAAASVALIGVGLTLFMVSRFGARRVLHQLRTTPWPRQAYPVPCRLVENLAVAAGLPVPALRLIDAVVPNALATGNSPAEATVAVSRGLIDLLDDRELEGVLAHEMSHVANEDTRLSTIVAAVVATVAWPVTAVLRVFRARSVTARVAATFVCIGVAHVLVFTTGLFLYLLVQGPQLLTEALMPAGDATTGDLPRWIVLGLYGWTLHGTFAPFYVLVAAPVVGLMTRRAVSRQREFLADADAVLLTRDPEGLALALIKIGAAHGTLRSAESIAHLFIAPPRGATRWFDRVFPTHPAVEDRVDMLARMGTGLDPRAVAEALEAGRLHKASASAEALADPAPPEGRHATVDTRAATAAATATEGAVPGALRDGPRIPVYERPDGWSQVIVQLGADAEVKLSGRRVGNFVQVTLPDGRAGWVGRAAQLAAVRGARPADPS